MELEGMVSKRADRSYRAGRCTHWVKVKNRKRPAWRRVQDSVLRDQFLVQKDTILTGRIVVEYAKHSVTQALIKAARLKAVCVQPCSPTASRDRFSLCLKQHFSTETGAAQSFRYE